MNWSKIFILMFFCIGISMHSAFALNVISAKITGINTNPVACGGNATVTAKITYAVLQRDIPINPPFTAGPFLARLYEDDGGLRRWDEVLSITTFNIPLGLVGQGSLNVTFPINCAAANAACLCDFFGNNNFDDEHGQHELCR